MTTLRVGAVCRGSAVERWEGAVIEHLLTADGVALEIVIIETPTNEAARGVDPWSPPLPRWVSDWLLARADFRRRVDLRSLLDSVPAVLRLPVEEELTSSKDDSPSPECSIIREVRRRALDVVIYMGSRDPRTFSLPNLRQGVWTFSFGDGGTARTPWPVWAAIERGDRTTTVTLERSSCEAGGPGILRRGVFRTVGSSLRDSADGVLSEVARWPGELCSSIARRGRISLCSDSGPGASERATAPARLALLGLLRSVVRNRLLKVAERAFRHDCWSVGLVRSPIQSFVLPGFTCEPLWLHPSRRGEYLADPFGYECGGRLVVLIEAYEQRTDRGHLESVVGLDTATPHRSEVDLRDDVHLSYPYLVKWRDSVFCVPESAHAGETVLYRGSPSPSRWERVATITDGPVVDPTLFLHEDVWWLAGTNLSRGPNHILFLWYSRDLLGPWRPHPHNPVKIDVRSARPAGTPFRHQGRLYRPAQDCSERYGGRIVINRVLHLSPDGFEEEVAAVVDPSAFGPGWRGAHTLSQVGSSTLVDAKRAAFVPAALLRNLAVRWGRTVVRVPSEGEGG